MDSTDIQKYKKRSTASLKLQAQKVFNKFIRERDKGLPCIACGKYATLQAGHFKSAGKFNHMRFMEENVHGQCVRCNYFEQQSDTLYRNNLIKKIGQKAVDNLDTLAAQRTPAKTDRFYLIEIIEKYK